MDGGGQRYYYVNVYKVRVQYGRGEMRTDVLVGAPTSAKAEELARQAAPVPCHKHDVKVELLADVTYTGALPHVICKL